MDNLQWLANLFIGAAGGGAGVKLLDILSNRHRANVESENLEAGRYERLITRADDALRAAGETYRADLMALRTEIADYRLEVTALRAHVAECDRERFELKQRVQQLELAKVETEAERSHLADSLSAALTRLDTLEDKTQ